MFFKFLRQFLKDDEFEAQRLELVENRKVLIEIKEILQKQVQLAEKESEKVDSGFLTFIWASIGVALAVVGTSLKTLVALTATRQLDFYIWLIFLIVSLIFVVANASFAFDLTIDYALSKTNRGYKTYALRLVVSALILAMGVIALVFYGHK